MSKNAIRWALVAIDAFAAVTAIGGGLALMAGLEADRFPAAWLRGTPFDGFVVPGLILAVLVGGIAAAAAATTVRSARFGGSVSLWAGVVMVGWIVGEILIVTKDAVPISPTEAVYLAVGITMVGLGHLVRRDPTGHRALP